MHTCYYYLFATVCKLVQSEAVSVGEILQIPLCVLTEECDECVL